jgi:hypothetical protein
MDIAGRKPISREDLPLAAQDEEARGDAPLALNLSTFVKAG